MTNTSILAVAGLASLMALATPTYAQEAAQQADQAAAPAAETAPAAQDWNAISRSGTRVYMVDVGSIKTTGGVSSIDLARVPLAPENRSAQNWTLVKMEIRCGDKQSRAVSETEHDDAGVALEAFESGETFSPYTAEMLDSYIAAVVCDGSRGEPPTFPSIAAYIAAGRPSTRR